MNTQMKQGWTSKLTPIDEALEPIADAVSFDLAVAEKVDGFDRSPESRLERSKDIMRRQIEQIDIDIKKTKGVAEVQIEQIEAETKSKNDQDQQRIDDLRDEIAEITASTKARSADSKNRIKSINDGCAYQIAKLEEYRVSAEAFLSASARKTN